MAGRLIHFRSTAKPRWFSIATATAVTNDTAATAATQDKPKVSLFHKLKELNIRRDSSDTNISVVLDEWAAESRAKRFDVVNQINFFRTRKNYLLALQVFSWIGHLFFFFLFFLKRGKNMDDASSF